MTLRAAQGMKVFVHVLFIETLMLKTVAVMCVLSFDKTVPFTQRQTEHADLLVTCTDWLFLPLFLLCDRLLD